MQMRMRGTENIRELGKGDRSRTITCGWSTEVTLNGLERDNGQPEHFATAVCKLQVASNCMSYL
jgi:hypothetical protein